MSALTIVQNAYRRLGFTAPSAVFSNTDDQVIQFRTLMNQEGQELARAHPWSRLLTEKTFTTVAAAIQTSAVPTDFGWFVNNTLWNRTLKVRYDGPVSAEEWQQYQSSALGIALPNGVFRFRGGELLIYPSPTVGQTGAYEYVSKYWASGSQDAMTADSDTALLDENLIMLGVVWRFIAAKGLDYAEYFRTYQVELEKAIGRDGGRRKAYIGGASTFTGNGNIPLGSWPG